MGERHDHPRFLICRAEADGYYVCAADVMMQRFEGVGPQIVFSGTRHECLAFVDARYVELEVALSKASAQ